MCCCYIIHPMHERKAQGSGVKHQALSYEISPLIFISSVSTSVYSFSQGNPNRPMRWYPESKLEQLCNPILSCLRCRFSSVVPGHSPLTKCVTRLRALFLDAHEEIGVTQSVVFVCLCANIFIFLFLRG